MPSPIYPPEYADWIDDEEPDTGFTDPGDLAFCPICLETPGVFIRTPFGLVCKAHA